MDKSRSKGRVELSLEDKVKLIKKYENQKIGHRALAQEFLCGKTQVQTVLKRKREFLDAYEENVNPSTKRLCRHGEFELNDMLWDWFQKVRSKNLPCSGPMLQQKAMEFAKVLGRTEFKASNGWLEAFKKRHKLGQSVLCGESASVDESLVSDWNSVLISHIEGYDMCDVYNMDETGLFYRSLPDKSLTVKGEQCNGGKRAKDRITIVLCANMAGEIRMPLVIGRSKKPHCFRNLDLSQLPVVWRYNKKAWMTGALFSEWLSEFDREMRRKKRKVILFLDNAPSHKHELTLTNTKIIFYPPNTTSRLQPLDQGVIQNFKSHCRTKMLSALVARMETSDSKADLAKAINVHDACMWTSYATNKITPATIQNCFHLAGYPTECTPTDDTNQDRLNQLIQQTSQALDFKNHSQQMTTWNLTMEHQLLKHWMMTGRSS